MAALLSSEMDGSERDKFFVDHIEDCRRMGIEVLQPDINAGEHEFSVLEEGKILFGLGAIKGVGTKAIEALVKARKEGGPFRSVLDIFERTSQTGRHPGERRDLDQGRRPRLPQGSGGASSWPSCPGSPRKGNRLARTRAGGNSRSSDHLRSNAVPSRRPRPSPCPTSPSCPTPSGWPRRRRRSAST